METSLSIFLSSFTFYGYLFSLIVIAILSFFLKREKNKLLNASKAKLARLRKIGERIPIMYDELEVKSNSWKQEIEVGSGTQSRNEYVDIHVNVITLSKTYRGHRFDQQYKINMEPEILRMKLALQNELSFYYNPNNFNECCLDFEFLYR